MFLQWASLEQTMPRRRANSLMEDDALQRRWKMNSCCIAAAKRGRARVSRAGRKTIRVCVRAPERASFCLYSALRIESLSLAIGCVALRKTNSVEYVSLSSCDSSAGAVAVVTSELCQPSASESRERDRLDTCNCEYNVKRYYYWTERRVLINTVNINWLQGSGKRSENWKSLSLTIAQCRRGEETRCSLCSDALDRGRTVRKVLIAHLLHELFTKNGNSPAAAADAWALWEWK